MGKSGLSAGFELHFKRMANIRYITGPLKSGKTDAVIREIVRILQTGQKAAAILPSVPHVQYLTKEILRRQPTVAPGQLFIGTFFAWAERILDENRQVFDTIPAAEEWLALRQTLLADDSPAHEYFPGYIQILTTIFNDLREGGLAAEQLVDLAAKSNNPDFPEWVKLFNAMRQKYRRQAAGPSGELLVFAAELLHNPPATVRGELLVIDGFYEFTPLQRQIIKNLAQSYTTTICTSITDSKQAVYNYCRNTPGLFGAGDTITLTANVRPPASIITLCQNLFDGRPLKDEKHSLSQSNWNNDWTAECLKIVQCPTRRNEVETAARTIKRWVADGLSPANIGVTFRGGYDYSGLVSLIFPDFGLPVVPLARSLNTAEPAEVLSRIIRINTENFSRPVLMDLLRLPALRHYYGTDLLQEFEIYSAEWGLPGRKSDWLNRCRQRIEYLQLLLQNESEETEQARHNAHYQIGRLRRMQLMLSQLLDDITLPSYGTFAEYHKKLNEILERYFADGSEAAAQPVEQIRAILLRLERIITIRENLGLNDLAGILSRFFESVKIRLETVQPGIYSGNLMDMRGLNFDGLILLGLVDGEFPANRAENALFRNDQRRALNQRANEQIFTESGADLAEDKFLLYLMASRVTQRLLVTYPEADNRGRVLPVSPFVNELLTCPLTDERSEAIKWEVIPAGQVLPETGAIASENDLLQVILTGTGEPVTLINLIDDNRLTQIRTRQNNERQRLSGDGLRNGVLSKMKAFPEFLAAPLSVTKLQNYIDCPFAYLCNHIWKIDVPGEPQIGLDPLAAGLLIHKTLELFVKKFQAAAPQQWPDFLDSIDDDRLNEIISKIAAIFRPQMNFIPELLWEQILSDLQSGLRNFIEAERQFGPTGFAPVNTEQQYTLEDESLRIGDEKSVQAILKGKVDRIDHNADGERFLIIDYKRSGGTLMDIVKGVQSSRQFQIPLYLLMVSNNSPAVRIGGAFYYSFNTGKRTRGFLVEPVGGRATDRSEFGRTPSLSQTDLDNLLEETRQRVADTLEQIYRGNFSLALRNENRCRTKQCEFYDICRVEAGLPI